MTCREFEEFLMALTPEVRGHARSCPECGRLLELIQRMPASEPDPAIVARVTRSVVESLQPVRPVAPMPVQVLLLVLAWAVISLIGAGISGFDGFHALTGIERIVIYATLTFFAVAAARLFASEMIPGSERPVGPVWLLSGVSLGILLEFFVLFHNYDMRRFVPEGVVCLENGLVHAIPVGFAAWMVLRRGFAVQPVSAGAAAGLIAGLGGIGLLEMHCPNLKVMHQAVWHVAVLPVSGIVGGIIGWKSELLIPWRPR